MERTLSMYITEDNLEVILRFQKSRAKEDGLKKALSEIYVELIREEEARKKLTMKQINENTEK